MMRLIKVGLANLDPTVGAFKENRRNAIRFALEMAEADCTIGCFPEQAIAGYPVEDLVLWREFVREQWNELLNFAAETSKIKTIFAIGLAVEEDSVIYNAAALVYEGKILGIVPKEKLPTYGVFYEKRTYSAGIPGRVTQLNGVSFGDIIFSFPFGTLALLICEDIFSPDGPMRRRAYSGAEIIINHSASPWRAGIMGTRRELISTRASDNLATVIYVNQVGGNDGLVFDGGGFVNQCGKMLFEAPRWREGFSTTIVDLDQTSRQRRENTTWRTDRELFLQNEKSVRCLEFDRLELSGLPYCNMTSYKYPVPAMKSFFIPSAEVSPSPREQYFEDLIEAMITGLDGYFRKTKAFKCIGIALSGGKDSALTLLIAYLYAKKWFKKNHEHFKTLAMSESEFIKTFIRCFSMPSHYNSDLTKSISKNLCDELGVSFNEVSIADEFERSVTSATQMLQLGEALTPLGLQNIQARIRGKRMWDWTNSTAKGMWLQTGNMSEKAVGYTTIGGDMMGAYSLIGNLPKTVVIALLEYMNGFKFNSPALGELCKSKASAELSFDQEDERDLMPFPVLDACYALFAGEKMMPYEVNRVLKDMWTEDELKLMCPTYTSGMLKEWVVKFVKLFRASIFKWVQAPQSVHLGSLDLDRERALQLPVVQSDEWLLLDELKN